MTHRRLADRLSVFVLVIGLLVVGVGFARAQSQDATNARIDERVSGMVRHQEDSDKRIDRMETAIMYGMVGLVANLGAHILQIRTQVQRRKRDEE